ncbi:LOW QUALITY PROTEIN: hypothetical protein QTO34_019762, partial [Cnephaeus nilssonii]
MESEYADLLLHNKGVHYPELTNDQWIQKFYFMVDVTTHLNQLNHKRHGKGNTIFSMLEEVISFENKLSLFAQDFERETLIHFPSLLKHRQENNSDIDICYYLQNNTFKYEGSFSQQEFRNSKATLAFVKKSLNATVTELNFSPFNIDIGNFEMQLLDLKNKELWSSKFEQILEKNKCELSSQHKWSALKDLEKEDMLIFNTWNSIPDSYNQLKKLAFAVLSLFGSTYLFEKSFSSMNLIKSKLRSRLIDENLESCLKLKTITYKPDLPNFPRRCKAIVHISAPPRSLPPSPDARRLRSATAGLAELTPEAGRQAPRTWASLPLVGHKHPGPASASPGLAAAAGDCGWAALPGPQLQAPGIVGCNRGSSRRLHLLTAQSNWGRHQQCVRAGLAPSVHGCGNGGSGAASRQVWMNEEVHHLGEQVVNQAPLMTHL